MKSESFLKGTIILIIANAVSKILGAVLKIPLTYILGEQGMAIYQTAFSVYIMLLSLITSGLPFAISKYIAEELALKRYGNVRFAMQFSAFIMLILGLIASSIMFFGADFFAFAMKDPKSPYAIQAIAPSILFVALGAVYKSCFQGYAHQTPTAISQVLEALVKLLVGYSLALFFSPFSVQYTSAAAVFGVTIGEAFATLVLFMMYIPYRKETRLFAPEHRRKSIAHALAAIAVPMTAASVISSSLSLLETSVIRNRLTAIVFTEASANQFLAQYSGYTDLFDNIHKINRLTFDGARWLYGAYSGYAATVFNLPAGILAAFGVSILPVVTRCLALKNYRQLRFAVSSTSKIILATATPCAAILALFSGQILDILFKNTASQTMLSCMAPLLVIITLTQFISSVEYSAGKILTPFLYGAVCMGIKIILSYILVSIPQINILGVIISSFVAAGIQLLLNAQLLKKDFDIKILKIIDVTKIFACTLVMSIIAVFLHNPMCVILKNNILGFFCTMLISLSAYLAAVFVFGIITKEEITKLRH